MSLTEWVQVARVSDVDPDTGFEVELGGMPVALWNVGGTIYATSNICTHEEAWLTDGDIWDGIVECPLHGAQFDVRTGAVRSLPAIFPLPTYPVKVEGDSVYVEWDKRT